jgi:hypothetical protein
MKAFGAALAITALFFSAANAEQLWPAGRYCGFNGLAQVGMTVYPAAADGTIPVTISSLYCGDFSE